jgi:protein SCO1/2
MNQTAATVADEGRASRPKRLSPWRWIAAGVTCLCVAVALWVARPSGDGSAFPFYGQWIGKDAPDFALTDQNGSPFRLSQLHGDVVLMTFGFTHCPNICPTTLANLSAICRGLAASGQQRVKVVFITVDPDRDNAKAMKDYVGFYSPDFIGATGSAEDIAKVAKAYGAYYEAQIQDSQVAKNYYTINHSAYIYLIDPHGRFAILYDNDKLADHDRMKQDIEHELAATGE